MSGFDLPPIQGFDIGMPQRNDALKAALENLGNLEGLQGPVAPAREVREIGGTAKPFDGVLADSLDLVKGLQDDTREKVRGLVMGEDVELHDVMIAGNKSEAAFNLLLEVRNKLVDAWEKLSRSSG